ncbi:MAG: hypothetical protein ACT4OY_04360 [Alphaproteobacteria bacterium]
MLSAKATQFKLLDDGRIHYQPQESNPLPGDAVAHITKGPGALHPAIMIDESAALASLDKTAVKNHLEAWLNDHIKTVLEPLVNLENLEAAAAPVRGIGFQLYESMGIVPREKLEDLISVLDPAMRQDLRARNIRLGPVLVFLPVLNKPAAVRLRAILWTLFRGNTLPAETPRDGIVSFKIDAAKIDRDFYQAVGYPVYGPRAIRIDMLDRVINAIYEGAKDGKFQAQHAMAEWLGCGIGELYEILEAMGHRKIQDAKPAEQNAAPAAAAAEETPAETETPKPAAKPELSFFRLKKGKAFTTPQLLSPRKRRTDTPDKDSRFRGKGKEEGKNKTRKPVHKKREERKPEPRIMSAEAKTQSESPFAILGQLKSRVK